MGEGIPHLLGLINDLCLAENKLFLIEEPENDIHPKALKRLLDLIIQKSQSNQFVISTGTAPLNGERARTLCPALCSSSLDFSVGALLVWSEAVVVIWPKGRKKCR
jgi:hypothetical protein